MQRSQPFIDAQAAYRRAGGRRRYNAQRRRTADARRVALVEQLYADRRSLWARGTQAHYARVLGVSRATICRDVGALVIALQDEWSSP